MVFEDDFTKSNRVIPYKNSGKHIEHINSIYGKPSAYNRITDSLDYDKDYIVSTINRGKIDINQKNVAYIYKKKHVKKDELREDDNLFYPMRYILIAENMTVLNCRYDYIFYIDDTHQEPFVDDKFISKKIKLLKKIKIQCSK